MARRTSADKEAGAATVARLLEELQQATKRPSVTVADALEFRRDQYGLTQGEFAKVLGMQPSHYSEVESGQRLLPRKAAHRAYLVGVPAEVLLAPTISKTPPASLGEPMSNELPPLPYLTAISINGALYVTADDATAQMLAYGKACAEQERERCAEVCEEHATWGGSNFAEWFKKCAAEIRKG